MKTKLKNSFKPTPERFEYAVREAVIEATEQAPIRKRRLNKGLKIAIAAVLIAALVPTTVFGASKLYELIAKPVDNYGLAIGVDSSEAGKTYPEYVKMHVDIPEGFAANQPDPDNMKFYSLSAEEQFTDGFSLYPMRFNSRSDMKEYIGNVESYEERVMNGHQAYEVTMINGAWSRLYVYYEDVNVFLLIYHKDVTEEQLEEFVNGISFTEGTPDDFTELYEPYDERPKEQIAYSYEEHFVEHPLDAQLTFQYDESVYYTAQIGSVRTLDNIAELDEDCFNPGYGKEEIADESGRLIPKTVSTIKEGDGFDSIDELLNSEDKDQVLVLADITYTNLSDEDIELFVPYRLFAYNQDKNGQFTPSDSVGTEPHVYMTETCDSEVVYMTPHGDGKGFYIPTLHANETLTVTIGFRCNVDLLDKAYLTLQGVTDVADPAPEGDAFRTVYLFKVQ